LREKIMRKVIIAIVLLVPALAFAQALPNINSLTVRYNSLKTAAKAEGELKAQLDEIDKAIADARRSGNLGEVRRQIAKGFTVLDKGTWTPQLDYRSSLALRSERIVIDSAVPYAMRIEQIYRPAIDLSTNLTTKVRIRKRVPPARAAVSPIGCPGRPRDARESVPPARPAHRPPAPPRDDPTLGSR